MAWPWRTDPWPRATAAEISIGFWKRDTGKPSITWPAELAAAETKRFKASRAAWAYWQTCPPGYRCSSIG